MGEIREVSIKFNVETAGGVAKIKGLTSAIDQSQKKIKETGKASTASARKFDKASKSMQTAAQRTAKKMRTLRASLGNIKESLNSLAQTARRTAAVMIGGAAALVAVYSRFEGAMMRSAAIASGSAAGFGTAFRSMSREAMKVANTTEHTAKQVGEGMEFMAMAGLKANKIVAATASVADLASSAGIGMADAANIATNVMTAFGRKSEDLTEIHNILTGTFTNSNVSLSQLAESMKVAGANASVLGLSMEEAAATIGLLGNVGMQGTESGTKLKRAISAMVHPSKQGATAMRNLALSEETLVKNSKFVEGGLLRLIARLQGSQKAFKAVGQDTKFLANVFAAFGERAGPAMAALLKQGTDAFIDLRYAQEEAKRTDITTWLAGLQRESTKGQWDIMVSNVTSAAIVLGQKLAPAAIKAMNAIKGLAEAIQDVDAEKLRAMAKGAVAVTAATAGVAGLLAFAGGIVAIKYAVAGLGGSGVILGSVATGLGGLAAVVAILSFPKLAGLAAGITLVAASFGVFAGIASSWPLLILGAAVLVGTLVASLAGLNDTFASGIPKSMDWSYAINEATDSSDGFATSLEAFGISFFSALLLDMKGINGELDELANRLGVIKAIKSGDPFHQFGSINDYLEDVDKRTEEKREKRKNRKEGDYGTGKIPAGSAVDLYAKAKEKLAPKINTFDLAQKEFEPVRKKIQRAIGEGVLLYVKDGISKLVSPSQRAEMLENKTAIDSNFQWSGSDLSQEEFDKTFGNVGTEEALKVREEAVALIEIVKGLVDDTKTGMDNAREAVGPLLKGLVDSGFSTEVVDAVRTALYASIESKSKANLVSLDRWLASLIKGAKISDKILAKAETNAAEQKTITERLKKSFGDLIRFLKGRTRDMKAQMMSAFSPDKAGGIKGAIKLEKEFNALSQKLEKAKVNINQLGKYSGVVSGYFNTLAASTFSQAGAALRAKVGTDQLSSAAKASASILAPALKSAALAAGIYSESLTFSTEEVQQKLEDYALAHADVTGMLKKATNDRMNAEGEMADAIKSAAALKLRMEQEREMLQSKSPQATAIMQQGEGDKSAIAEIGEAQLRALEKIRDAAIKEAKMAVLAKRQIEVREELMAKMGTLGIEIKTLTGAVNELAAAVRLKAAEAVGGDEAAKAAKEKEKADGTVYHGKGEEYTLGASRGDPVGSSSTASRTPIAGMGEAYAADGYVSDLKVSELEQIFKDILNDFKEAKELVERDMADLTATSKGLDLDRAKSLLAEGGTLEDLNSIFSELKLSSADAGIALESIDPATFEADFTGIEDGLFRAAMAGFGKIHKIEMEDGKIIAKSLIVPGAKMGSEGIQSFVNAAKMGAEKISSWSKQGTTGIGGLAGGAVGAAIGGMFGGQGSAIGKMVGEFIGNILETIIMALPGMIIKAAQIAYGLIEKAVGVVKKAVKVVPEQRFQGGVEFGSKFIAPILTAVTPVIAALVAFGAAVAFATNPFIFMIPTIEGLKIIGGLLQFSVIPALLAMGAALAAFLLFIGAQEIKFDKVLGAPDTNEETVDAPERTAFKKIMDGLSASVDRVVLAMNPFYEKLFVLVGLFDYIMQAFIIFSQALTGADFEESLFAVFKRLTLGIIDTVIAIARLHNMFVMLSRVSASWGMIIPPATVGTLSLTKAFGSTIKALGEWINNIPGLDGQGNWAVNTGTDMMESATDELGNDFQGTVDEIGELLRDLGSYIDIGELETLRDNLASKSLSDILGRSMDLIGMGDESGAGKEFGEQLTNVPSGFKVNLARYNAMDAAGDGGALDMDGGRSIMDIDATDFFGRMTQAVRAGTAESLGSLANAIGSLDDVIRPDEWEGIFGHPLDRMSNELGNAFDSLTNTLGFALLGPEEAFQGGGMGAAMGGKHAGGNVTSGGNNMTININELSIADAANPEQLASMISERSTRNQMAQAGTPFPSHQSGAGWWGGNEGGGGRS